MPRPIADYVAIALIANKDDDSFYTRPRDFSGDLLELKAHAEERCGFEILEATLRDAIRTLADCGLIRITDDAFSGTFVKVKSSQFESFIEKAHAEMNSANDDGISREHLLSRRSDFPLASGLALHEIVEDYHELGEVWLRKALQGLQAQSATGRLEQSEARWVGSAIEDEVPASDRVVTLTDNQASLLEESSSTVIAALEKENAVDGEVSLRAVILGQLKAGRELIRAQSLNVFLLHQTLFRVLAGLIERYKDQALGHAAKKLLDLLVEHVFGK